MQHIVIPFGDMMFAEAACCLSSYCVDRSAIISAPT